MMNIIRAIIVEDNADQRRLLCYQLKNYPEIKIIAEAEQGDIALQLIKKYYPDVVFLDIDLPQMNGIEIAKSLRKNVHAPLFVFFTSYSQFAVEGFEVDALDYLVKPINNNRLDKTIRKIKKNLEYKLSPYRTKDNANQSLQFTTVKLKNRSLVVNVNDIFFFFVEDANVFVQMKDRSGGVKYRSLKQLMFELDPQQFVRVHRKYLVNVEKIKEIMSGNSQNPGCIVMKDKHNTEIMLSRRGAKTLRNIVKW